MTPSAIIRFGKDGRDFTVNIGDSDYLISSPPSPDILGHFAAAVSILDALKKNSAFDDTIENTNFEQALVIITNAQHAELVRRMLLKYLQFSKISDELEDSFRSHPRLFCSNDNFFNRRLDVIARRHSFRCQLALEGIAEVFKDEPLAALTIALALKPSQWLEAAELLGHGSTKFCQAATSA